MRNYDKSKIYFNSLLSKHDKKYIKDGHKYSKLKSVVWLRNKMMTCLNAHSNPAVDNQLCLMKIPFT